MLRKPTVAQSLAAEFNPLLLVADPLNGGHCIAFEGTDTLTGGGYWQPLTVTTSEDEAAALLFGAITAVFQLRLIAKSAGRV